MMLRVEQGFDDSVYQTESKALQGYTDHHRLLMPALAVYDLLHTGTASNTVDRLKSVKTGAERSLTLAFERDHVHQADRDLGWLAVRDSIIDNDHEAGENWRLEKRPDVHAMYPGFAIWTATRNLLRLENETDQMRVRERYTFAADDEVSRDAMLDLLIANEVPEDVVIATATVYALNKSVPKPKLIEYIPDISQYEALNAAMQQNGKS